MNTKKSDLLANLNNVNVENGAAVATANISSDLLKLISLKDDLLAAANDKIISLTETLAEAKANVIDKVKKIIITRLHNNNNGYYNNSSYYGSTSPSTEEVSYVGLDAVKVDIENSLRKEYDKKYSNAVLELKELREEMKNLNKGQELQIDTVKEEERNAAETRLLNAEKNYNKSVNRIKLEAKEATEALETTINSRDLKIATLEAKLDRALKNKEYESITEENKALKSALRKANRRFINISAIKSWFLN